MPQPPGGRKARGDFLLTSVHKPADSGHGIELVHHSENTESAACSLFVLCIFVGDLPRLSTTPECQSPWLATRLCCNIISLLVSNVAELMLKFCNAGPWLILTKLNDAGTRRKNPAVADPIPHDRLEGLLPHRGWLPRREYLDGFGHHAKCHDPMCQSPYSVFSVDDCLPNRTHLLILFTEDALICELLECHSEASNGTACKRLNKSDRFRRRTGQLLPDARRDDLTE